MGSADLRGMVGTVLSGKYRLDKVLGSGGVGTVFRAENTLVGRTVAIKVLHPDAAQDERMVQRFMREARVPNLVGHPNIVDVLDMGVSDEGTPFLVEEFLEGEDLGAHIARHGGKLPVAEALDILLPIVDATGVAHKRGVVHRDLKPENIILARIEGETVPKLVDFGISHMREMPDSIRVTSTGTTVGTPAYMSPEQLEGVREVGSTTDVWALGVVIFEVISGRLPFQGDTAPLVFSRILSGEVPPLESVAPNAPPGLCAIVMRCLLRDPSARYPDASELANELRTARKKWVEVRVLRPDASGVGAERRAPGSDVLDTLDDIVVDRAANAHARDAAVVAGAPPQGVSKPLVEQADSGRAAGIAWFDMQAQSDLPIEAAPSPPARSQPLSSHPSERVRPVRSVASPSPTELAVHPGTGASDERGDSSNVIPGVAALGLSVAGAAAAAAALAWRSDGWPAVTAVVTWMDGRSIVATALGGGSALLLGVVGGLHAWKEWRTWRGAVVSAFGLILAGVAGIAQHASARLADIPGGSPVLLRIVVIGIALTTLGAGLQGMVSASILWTDGSLAKKAGALAAAAAGGLALFATLEVVLTLIAGG